MPSQERGGAGRHWVAVGRRRAWVVGLATLVVVAAALVGSALQTPVYRARARVLAEVPTLLSSTADASTAASSTETEAEVLASEPVQTLVRQRLGEAPPVEAEPVGRSSVMEVVAESSGRAQAAAVANAYSQAYVDYRRQQTADRLLSATREVGAKVDELSRQIDGLGTNDPRRSTLLSQLGVFRAQLDQLQVDAALIGGGPQVLVRATEPERPVKPRTGRNLAVASGAGLLLGLLLAALLERLDSSVRTRTDLERAAPGARLLASVPRYVGSRGDGEPVLVSRADPASATAEAYRSIRASLRALASERPLRTVLVTAPPTGDGRSATVANLATALARAGQEVVAAGCDLRTPRLHELFGVSNKVGFTSVLLGEVPLSAALQKIGGEPRLRFLPSGPIPPNPSELLSSQRATEVLTALAAQVDWVIAEAPALGVSDATVLANQVDGVVLVVSAGVATRAEVADALAELEPTKAPVLGLVLDANPPLGASRRRQAEPPRGADRSGSSGGSARSSAAAAPRRAPLRPGAGVPKTS
ncbi:MAG TPA: polysaccharide biosynthesis tyrosine autokinase [Acidimicrobiales bacterium]|nr:polysaccharide biosynthesis tyrosine autokinase [Acidimicrobiales bacterium]